MEKRKLSSVTLAPTVPFSCLFHFLFLFLFLFSRLPIGAAEPPSEKEINATLASPDSHIRHNTWKRLNPEKESHYKICLQILGKLSWHDRDGAIEALATAATEATINKMFRDLKGHKDLAVRQGLAVALAKMDDEKYYPKLLEVLKDKNAFVRRALVHYLGIGKKSKEKVQALIDAFQTEKDPVVGSFFVNALNDQTRAFQGPDPKAWFIWWEEAKADKDFELGKTDEEAEKKAEELGNKLKKRSTVSAAGGVTLETEERGKGKAVPILILPDYSISKETMLPFLSELEKTHKLFYIDLPEINKFKELKTVSEKKIPVYPIDQLVAAFEDLRKATGQDRFAIMACGMNCWIAMRYVTLHPQSVSHVVLIGPVSSGKVFGEKVVDRWQKEGKAKNDVELWHLGLAWTIDPQTGVSHHDQYHEKEKIPKPEGEDASLDRRHWSLYFRDDRDSVISMLYPKKTRPLGSVVIPHDFSAFSGAPGRVPTIVICGRSSMLSSAEDCQAIAKHYGGQCFIYEGSSMMPFCEESSLFNKHMAALLREAVSKKKSSSDKTEEASERRLGSKKKSPAKKEPAAGKEATGGKESTESKEPAPAKEPAAKKEPAGGEKEGDAGEKEPGADEGETPAGKEDSASGEGESGGVDKGGA